MGAAYSQYLRDRVLAAYDRGMQTRQIAQTFAVSPAWARRVKQRWRETGETTPRAMGGVTVLKIDMDRLRELVRTQPDATTQELHARLGVDAHGRPVGGRTGRLPAAATCVPRPSTVQPGLISDRGPGLCPQHHRQHHPGRGISSHIDRYHRFCVTVLSPAGR